MLQSCRVAGQRDESEAREEGLRHSGREGCRLLGSIRVGSDRRRLLDDGLSADVLRDACMDEIPKPRSRPLLEAWALRLCEEGLR